MPRPCLTSWMPSSAAASLGLLKLLSRVVPERRMVSCLRAIVRSMLRPQTLRPGLKEMVLKGIRISADQPSSRRALSASQMPSQLRLVLPA